MTKKTLLKISAAADALDLVTGWIPGPWTLIVDVPVFICHFLYAGPRALWVLTDNIPIVGILPIYTIAAMAYPEKGQVSEANSKLAVIDVEPMPEVQPSRSVQRIRKPRKLN
ncbi:MAG: hypothetical protein JWM68_2081 [Verrucomicrobiales bacterium]|nr:hypothetical protein [Verrucomicrobiales bacterium]